MKIKKEKRLHEPVLSEYSIIDRDEDDNILDTEKIAKKIREVSFF